MKASELRIGNLLYQEQTIDDWEIKSVLAGTIIQCEINPDGFEPININREILLMLGFEPKRYELQKEVGLFIFGFDIELNLIIHWGSGQLDEGLDDIKYVHQLQNLYFALTGEELIIEKNGYARVN